MKIGNYIFILLFSLFLLLPLGLKAERPHRIPPPPSCKHSIYPDEPIYSIDSRRGISQRAASPVDIDLLIGYTPDALLRVGSSVDSMIDHIRRIIDFTNKSHQNSGTGVTFRVVKIIGLTTNASDNFTSDLVSASSSDGVWDELITQREANKADMVSILVGGTQGGTICGLGYSNGGSGSLEFSSPYMYNIVSLAPSCSFATITHELGHNLGSAHDRANATSSGFQSFSYGYSFKGKSKNSFHTIMGVTSDIEIPYFSSPLISYEETPIGVPGSEDNAQSIILAASTVANYYESLNGEDLSRPIPESPSKITSKAKRSKSKINITYTLKSSSSVVPYAPIHVYYSRGKRGKLILRSFGKTNSKGIFKFSETSRIAKGYYYRACHLGSSRTRLCSANLELASVN